MVARANPVLVVVVLLCVLSTTGSTIVKDKIWDCATTHSSLAYYDTHVTFEDVTFQNCVNMSGGAILAHRSQLQFNRCVFASNTAHMFGGALALFENSSAQIANCTFVDNRILPAQDVTLASAGAVYADPTSTISIRDSVFVNNSILFTAAKEAALAALSLQGGAISASSAEIVNTQFIGNSVIVRELRQQLVSIRGGAVAIALSQSQHACTVIACRFVGSTLQAVAVLSDTPSWISGAALDIVNTVSPANSGTMQSVVQRSEFSANSVQVDAVNVVVQGAALSYQSDAGLVDLQVSECQFTDNQISGVVVYDGSADAAAVAVTLSAARAATTTTIAARVLFEDSVFERNAIACSAVTTRGGAVSVNLDATSDASFVEVQMLRNVFRNNSVSLPQQLLLGGAVHMNIVAASKNADSCVASVVVDQCTFEGNRLLGDGIAQDYAAIISGGALYLEHSAVRASSSANITRCVFVDNRVLLVDSLLPVFASGGALAVNASYQYAYDPASAQQSGSVVIAACEFVRNRIALNTSEVEDDIEIIGGALWLQSSMVQTSVGNLVTDCNFTLNSVKLLAGYFGSSQVQAPVLRGGAAALVLWPLGEILATTLVVQQCDFSQNQVAMYNVMMTGTGHNVQKHVLGGGAMLLAATSTQNGDQVTSVLLQAVTFASNAVVMTDSELGGVSMTEDWLVGGAMLSLLTASQDSTTVENTRTHVSCQQCVFTQNSIDVQNSRLSTFRAKGGALFHSSSFVAAATAASRENAFVCAGCAFLNNGISVTLQTLSVIESAVDDVGIAGGAVAIDHRFAVSDGDSVPYGCFSKSIFDATTRFIGNSLVLRVADGLRLNCEALGGAVHISNVFTGASMQENVGNSVQFLGTHFSGNAVQLLNAYTTSDYTVMVAGGAVYLSLTSTSPGTGALNEVVFSNCSFDDNAVLSTSALVPPTTDLASVGGHLYIYSVNTGVVSVNAVRMLACNFTGGIVQSDAAAGGGAIASAPGAGTTELLFEQCLFVNNTVVSVESAASGGAVLSQWLWRGVATELFDQCVFANNSAQSLAEAALGNAIALGGAMSLQAATQVANSRFMANIVLASGTQRRGGAMMVSTYSPSVANCSFTQSYAAFGGAIFVGNGVSLEVSWSRFAWNGADSDGGALFVEDGSLELISVVLHGNIAKANGGALAALTTTTGLSFLDCHLANNTAAQGGGIFVGSAATLQVQASMFLGNVAVSAGGAVYGSGPVVIVESQFVECVADTAAALWIAAESSLTDLLIVGNVVDYATVYINTVATVVMSGVNISQNSAVMSGCGALCISGSGTVLIEKSDMSGNYAADGYGAAVTIGGSGEVRLQQVRMNGNHASGGWGGSLAFQLFTGTAVLENCTFSNGKAYSGGAMWIGSGSDVSLLNILFLQNEATFGGAIYAEGGAENVLIRDCLFGGNAAKSGGGATYLQTAGSGELLNIDATTLFIDNSAAFGNNSASVATVLMLTRFVCATCSTTVATVADGGRYVVPSGAELNIELTMFDAYGNVVSKPEVPLPVTLKNSSVCIGGADALLFNGAHVHFDVTVNEPIGSLFELEFECSQLTANNTVVVPLLAGNCTGGFGSISSSGICASCQTCPLSTFNLGSSVCAPCVTGATCQGGYAWSTNGHYVLFNEQNELFVADCLPDMCLAANIPLPPQPAALQYTNADALQKGLVPQWRAGVNQCQGNRTGFLCAQCDEGFSLWDNNCVDCRNSKQWLLVFVTLGYWVEVVVLHMVFSGRQGSGVAQILIDYVQVVLLLIPSGFMTNVLSFFNVRLPNSAGLCLFGRPHGFYDEFVQNLIIAAANIAQLLLSFVAIVIVGRVLTRRVDPIRWLVRPLVSLTLALYTPLTNSAMTMLTCRDVMDWSVLVVSPAILCDGSVYLRYQIASIVIIVTVTVGVPLAILILLARKRAELHSNEAVRRKFGGLYERFSASTPWWIVVILLRRSVISALLTAAAKYGFVGNYIVVLWSALMLAVQMQLKPLQGALANVVADLSLLSVLFVSASGMTEYVTVSQQQASGVQIWTACLIAITLVMLMVALIYISKETIARVFRRVLAWCGRNRKQEDELKTEQDEKQSLMVNSVTDD